MELVFNLLEIEKEGFKEVAELIEKFPEKHLIISHKHGFVLSAFQEYLNKEITEEEFIQIWDIHTKMYNQPLSSQEIIDKLVYQIKENGEYPKNTIFVLDWKVVEGIDSINSDILKGLTKNWSYVVVLR